MYATLDIDGLVLAIGNTPDDACSQLAQHDRERLCKIVRCDDDVVACWCAGNDVIVSIVNGIATI
jgi:hypothetical protein